MNKICTSLDQSQKLIELGIDVNTADMIYTTFYGKVSKSLPMPKEVYDILKYPIDGDKCILAWSLSALLELIPPYLGEFNDGIDFGFGKAMNGKWYSAHYIQLDNSGTATFSKTVTGETSIDAAFELVCWLKETGKI